MIYNKKEIILFLDLYSISKIKKIELEHNNTINNDYIFYSYIVKKVEDWFSDLENDELELIKDRHIKNLTFDNFVIEMWRCNK